jgi:phosphoglycerate dehydrogenase-like enzyme
VTDRTVPPGPIVVAVPDSPDLDHLGTVPSTVDLVRLPPWPGDLPDLRDAQMIIVGDSVRVRVVDALDRLPRLAAIQTLSAGVDWLSGVVPAGVTVYNARGVYDSAVAEWVVGAILAMQRGLMASRDAQHAGTWSPIVPSELLRARVLVLGYGSIGRAVAVRLQPFGVEVVGVARHGRGDALGIEQLDDVLPFVDVLVDLLPLTAETARLLGRRRLSALPDGALVVNAGRGATLDTRALLEELRAGRLRAALDVTDPEPLPDAHPLWALPNVLITPHIAGDSPGASRQAFALAGDQIRRYAAGEELLNQVPAHLLT